MSLIKKILESCNYSLRVNLTMVRYFLLVVLGILFFLVFMILGAVLIDPSLWSPFFGGVVFFTKSYPLFCVSILLIVCLISLFVGRQKTIDLLIHILESLYAKRKKKIKKNFHRKFSSCHFYVHYVFYFLVKQTKTLQLVLLAYSVFSLIFLEFGLCTKHDLRTEYWDVTPRFCAQSDFSVQRSLLTDILLAGFEGEHMELPNPEQTENKNWSILVHFMENKRLNVEVLQKIAQSFEDLYMREPEFFDFTLTHFTADQLTINTFFHLETSTSSVPVEVDFDAKNPQGDSGPAGNEVVGPHLTSSEHEVIRNPDNSPNNSPKLFPVTHFLEEICIPFKTDFVPLEN